MTRKKVKLAFISNDSSRKATYKKRKKGLMKKVNELSTLCGITACAVVYSPYDNSPEVWPSNSGVQRVISEFKTLPEMDQHKKMVDQEAFLKQRIAKATENLRRQRKDNRELEMTEVMFQCLMGNIGMFHLNIVDLNDLGYLIDQYLKDINRRVEIMGNSGMEIGESSSAAAAASEGNRVMVDLAAATTTPTATTYEVGGSSSAAAVAGLFNPTQQFRYPMVPHGGVYEQQPPNLSLNLSHNHNQNQPQWYMDMVNHEQMRYPAEHMRYPFMDDNHNNHNHIHHHHQEEQQHQNHGESSTAPDASNSTSVIPATSPNATNNIWFR